MKEFNPSPWFDRLVGYSKRTRKAQYLLPHLNCHPTRKNLIRLRKAIVNILPVELANRVLATVDAILEGTREIKANYRFRFHSYPKRQGQCSATGELFSLIRQAIN